MTGALIASLVLGAVMTFGDFAWAALGIRHQVVYGVLHGAAMCLCLGLAIGVRARRPWLAAVAGLIIGVIAAATFYALAPVLRIAAMFPAWMLLWGLFAMFQHRLRPIERPGVALLRGLSAAVLSGVAFYLISGIWTRGGDPNYAVNFASWSFAFLPGFLALFWGRSVSDSKEPVYIR